MHSSSLSLSLSAHTHTHTHTRQQLPITCFVIAPDLKQSAGTLIRPRKCWLCKAAYTNVHHHYDQFCPECASFNYTKRQMKADLTGRVALVTGGM